MATKVDKKNAIRQGITEAEIVYFQNLAGKTFLYVCGDEYFEVSFPIDHFLHLTGVETRLSTKDFYKNAKKSILTNNQFYFDARHVYANAKRKLPCLKRLPELTNEMVCVLKNMETMTITYKLSVTNLEICITKISTFLILCDLAVCLATLYVSFSLVFALMRYLQGKVFLIRFYSPTTLSSSRAEFRLPSRLACA